MDKYFTKIFFEIAMKLKTQYASYHCDWDAVGWVCSDGVEAAGKGIKKRFRPVSRR